MFVPKAVYEILKDYPDGLTAKKITEEVIARGLHPLPAKQPVSIVTRAIHRHCIGIDRTYSCQDRFFSKSTNKQGDTVYKIAANYSTTTTAIAETFVFPQQQIAAINSSSTASGSKTRIMDAENQTVRELLGKYCFYVPAYQRSYSWKSSHIDEYLFASAQILPFWQNAPYLFSRSPHLEKSKRHVSQIRVLGIVRRH